MCLIIDYRFGLTPNVPLWNVLDAHALSFPYPAYPPAHNLVHTI